MYGAIFTANWIGACAGGDYQRLCHEVGALPDGAMIRRLGPVPQDAPSWGGLAHRFATATRLEVGFCDVGGAG